MPPKRNTSRPNIVEVNPRRGKGDGPDTRFVPMGVTESQGDCAEDVLAAVLAVVLALVLLLVVLADRTATALILCRRDITREM